MAQHESSSASRHLTGDDRLLSSEQYLTWSVQLEALLSQSDAWKVVSGAFVEPADTPVAAHDRWVKANSLAWSQITLSLHPSLVYLVKDHRGSALDAWTAIRDQFAPTDDQGTVRLLARLFSLRLASSSLKDVDAFIKEYKELLSGLEAAKTSFPSLATSAHILSVLPPVFAAFKTSLGTRSAGGLPKPQELFKLLRDEAFRSEDTDHQHATALAASGGMRPSGGGLKPPRSPCPACQGPHWMRLCPHTDKVQAFKASKARGAPSANLAQLIPDFAGVEAWMASAQTADPDAWFIDSGASHHITGDLTKLVDVVHCRPEHVGGIANAPLFAVAVGTATLPTLVDGVVGALVLKHTLYVPGASKNLVSVRRLAGLGLVTQFDRRAWIKAANGALVAVGDVVPSGLYRLALSSASPSAAVATAPASLTTWHRRFAHLSPSSLKALAARDLCMGFSASAIANSEGSQCRCNACFASKVTRVSYPPSMSRATAPHELVHSDLLSITTPSLSGKRYVLTFVDDNSRKLWAIPLALKSDTFAAFREWQVLVEKQLGRPVKVLRSDNGGEYFSNAFADHCTKHGLVHQHTAPHTPEQNGVAERVNRTIVEGILSMLTDSGLPLQLWAEALSAFVFVKNRSPHRALQGDLPERLYRGTPKIDVGMLRSFGCRAWMHVPHATRRKLDPRGVPLVFVGYATNAKAYRLLDPATMRVHISQNVTFVENEFPFLASSPMNQGGGGTAPLPVHLPDATTFAPPQRVDSEPLVTTDGSARSMTGFELAQSTGDSQSSPIASQLSPAPSRSSSPDPLDLLGDGAALAAVATAVDEVNPFELPGGEPTSYRAALRSPRAEEWQAAINAELDVLRRMGTWDVVDRPTSANVVGCKWVFRAKRNAQGAIVRYKARLVAKGFTQQENVDFHETFAPVLKFTSLRTLIALAAQHGYHIHQGDVESAFLNPTLKEVVFMSLPEGFTDPTGQDLTGKCLRLVKTLYGLKQSPREWNEQLDDVLRTTMGFSRLRSDPCLYVHGRGTDEVIYLAVYVDDILFVSPSLAAIRRAKLAIGSAFSFKDLGPAEFVLGIQILRDAADGSITLSQATYIADVLKRFRMEDCKPARIPMVPRLSLAVGDAPADAELKSRYLSAVGSLMYAMLGTRPDLAFAVGYLGRFAKAPTSEHWAAIAHVLRYLQGTAHLGLRFAPRSADLAGLAAYSDADWAADVHTSRSTNGYVFTLAGGAVSWCSKLQSRVTQSSNEAEYLGLRNAANEAVHLSQLLGELGFTVPRPLVLHGDNQGALAWSKDAKQHSRSKQVRLDEHLIRELVTTGVLSVSYIPTASMIADIFTKALPSRAFVGFREQLGVVSTLRASGGVVGSALRFKSAGNAPS